ncbi:MAG: 2,3-bisphosphoglycerate-independent phosphoglycerate mutase, partial [Cyanobacteria bacterium REEB65]|nr:2,3-bisphosphoglycerate-independent phosphoglycerate mutase [Cyanobacteria bacterium REEB65]
MSPRKPVVLVILDGFGIHPDPDAPANAIKLARKPQWDRLLATYPHSQIPTSGEAVGLPPGQMGNSEVGHLNMGAGRIVYQDLTRIDKSIHDGDFFANPALLEAMLHARAKGTAVHLLGLVSDGGVHSQLRHLLALLKMARDNEVRTVWIHAFTDGRDRPPTSGAAFMATLEAECARLGVGQVATVSGRYFAMDRDKRWDRVEKAWRALMTGQAQYRAPSGTRAVEQAYERGETDEFIVPTVCADAGRIAVG